MFRRDRHSSVHYLGLGYDIYEYKGLFREGQVLTESDLCGWGRGNVRKGLGGGDDRLTLWATFTVIPMMAQRAPEPVPCRSARKR